MDIVRVKAELLCYGMAADDETLSIFRNQNPNNVWKTGNNGCFIEFGGTNTLVSVAHKYNIASPFRFSQPGILYKEEVPIFDEVKATIYPEWYKITLSTGRLFTEVFLFEGRKFFHQAYKGCDYMAARKGCAFCSTGLRNLRESTPIEIGEAAGIITEKAPDSQICLGGGTYLPVKSNVDYFRACIREIRKRNSTIPIWVEMVPPSLDDIQSLIDEGATAFGFNLEIWDDELRHLICPGKAEISQKHYLRALEYVSKQLPNRAGSCLIAGIDTEKNLKKGVDAVVSSGAHPCILPFKPFTGSKLQSKAPCSPGLLIDLSEYANDKILTSGLDLFENQGCMLCESCTVMHDIWKKKTETT